MPSLSALLTVTLVGGATLLVAGAASSTPAQRAGSGEQSVVAPALREPTGAGAAPTPAAPPGTASTRAPTQTAPRGRWRWPILPRPPVARPFDAPSSTWGAGHRGVDLAAPEATDVRAVADGAVTHVGVIAGRPTVTVTHPDGIRSTYEPVEPAVRTGQVVAVGQVIGTLVTDGSHCAPGSCLHLGALRGDRYLDPLQLLGPTRVRLLPLWN
ncbi:M23 family metallopeptidase [Knoellia koreensis]|uniref:M23 family metallopeptidase n=1 Tax=Knoellia koreensis TaxID=2730921 RepID=A0A849HCA2_9MICO|nr:peptidoglycan DD-metalloendopeptidase family protein [Knoellia sp. DB2414S]NNM45565.1 M23 family metallopeptidase [Knoellia sp. DB2414S]